MKEGRFLMDHFNAINMALSYSFHFLEQDGR